MDTTEQIDRLTIQINELEVADTAFEKYARYGMSLLKDLTWYFQEAEPQAPRKLFGSIFPAKLVFQDGNYGTSALNPALAPILQKNKGLQNEKAEDIAISENVSGDVGSTGALSNQFIEGMKLLYELEPLIKVKPYLTNQWEKGNKMVKTAS